MQAISKTIREDAPAYAGLFALLTLAELCAGASLGLAVAIGASFAASLFAALEIASRR